MKKNLLKKVCNTYLVASCISTCYVAYKFVREARGTGKENDILLLSKAIDRMSGTHITPDNVITIDGQSVEVSYNPYLILFATHCIGVKCFVTRERSFTEVYIDDGFRRLSEETQWAVLCHELGHYRLNHKASPASYRKQCVKNNGVMKQEVEADVYAASIVGYSNMYNALKELANSSTGYTRKEFILRMDILKTKHQNGEI